MSVSLVGVTALGGVPLFSRQSGRGESQATIPFATLAALNGVNLFSRLNEANLLTTSTANTKIHWKVFKGSVVLILMATTDSPSFGYISDQLMDNMLHHIFDSLILCCGLNEIIGQNIERLKRSLKAAYPLMDYILQSLSSGTSFNLLTQRVCYSFTDPQALDFMTSLTESYAQLAQSAFACLLVNHKLISATKSWWTLLSKSKDALLILTMVSSLDSSDDKLQKAKEVSIYLPENAPNSVTRLIVVQVHKNVLLVVLCGEHPTLEFLESEAIESIKQSEAHQEQFEKVARKEGQPTLQIDEKLMGFIFSRNDLRLYTKYGNFDDNRLREILKATDMSSNQPHVNQSKARLSALFPLSVPLTQMRVVSLKTMANLCKDKKLWPQPV